MKNLCLSFMACGLVLVFIQTTGLIEAVKVKKVVKDAAILGKKYGYLLASRKKKLYAVPFPMPLPVFIKRQQIYTQVPIIPRYVQHPQPYGTPAHATESMTSYDTMTSQPSYLEVASESAPSQRSKSTSSSTSASSSSYQDSSSSTGGSGKYLSQLANIIGQSVPVFGSSAANTNRDLMNKLLSGQAKILPPTSLLSAIKSPSAALAKYQKLQKQQHKQQDSSDSSKEQDQESKYETSSQNGSDSPTDTTQSPSSASSASPDSTRSSASELHRVRQRTRSSHGALIASASDQRRVPVMFPNQLMSIASAAMAARQTPASMGRIPVNQLATANQYLSLLDSAQVGHLEQLEAQSSDSNEQVVDGQSQQADDDEHGQQQMEQRRQLLKMALLRERQEAERLLEARMVLARAKQIGQQQQQQQQAKRQTPLNQQQQQQLMAQLINNFKQNQMEQQFQQMRYLQLVRQQQLAQNSIDK